MRDPETAEDLWRGNALSGRSRNAELKEKIAVLLDQMRTDLSIKLD